MDITKIKEQLTAIRERRRSHSMPLGEVRDALGKIFDETLCSQRDFIDEGAMVLHQLSAGLGGCCLERYDSWKVVSRGDFIVGGGFRIDGKGKILSLEISKKAGSLWPPLKYCGISLERPVDSLDALAEELVGRGYANENVLSALKELFSNLTMAFREHMEKVEQDIDRLLDGESKMGLLMKSLKVGELGSVDREKIATECLDALKPLEANMQKMVETFLCLEEFERTIGESAVRDELGELANGLSRYGIEHEFENCEYDFTVAVSVKNRGDGGWRIFFNIDNAHNWWEELRGGEHNDLEKQVEKVVRGDFDRIQLLHLQETVSRAVAYIMNTIDGVGRALEKCAEKCEMQP